MNIWKKSVKNWAGFSVVLLTGLTHVEWKGEYGSGKYDMAVRIEECQTATFEVLDDFGGTLLRLETKGEKAKVVTGGKKRRLSEKKFKKLLSIPLGPRALVWGLCERVPQALIVDSPDGHLKIKWQKIYSR